MRTNSCYKNVSLQKLFEQEKGRKQDDDDDDDLILVFLGLYFLHQFSGFSN